MGISVLSSAPALTASAPADDVAAGPSAGVSPLAARGDHAHRTPPAVLQTLLTATAPVDADLTAAAVGTALLAAKGDHRHKLGDSGWLNLTLINGWVNYDVASFGPSQYRKIGGVVFCRGLVKSGTASSDIATLPVGYRPGYIHIYPAENSGAYTRLDILANGIIHVFAGLTSYVSLCSLMFVAEQ